MVRVTSKRGQPRTTFVEDVRTVTEDIAVVYLTAEGDRDGSAFMQAEDNDDCFLEVKACELHTACATYAVNGFLAERLYAAFVGVLVLTQLRFRRPRTFQ